MLKNKRTQKSKRSSKRSSKKKSKSSSRKKFRSSKTSRYPYPLNDDDLPEIDEYIAHGYLDENPDNEIKGEITFHIREMLKEFYDNQKKLKKLFNTATKMIKDFTKYDIQELQDMFNKLVSY